MLELTHRPCTQTQILQSLVFVCAVEELSLVVLLVVLIVVIIVGLLVVLGAVDETTEVVEVVVVEISVFESVFPVSVEEREVSGEICEEKLSVREEVSEVVEDGKGEAEVEVGERDLCHDL